MLTDITHTAGDLPVMLIASTGGFILALLMPWLRRSIGTRAVPLAALLPAGLALLFTLAAPGVWAGRIASESFAWIEPLGLHLDFRLDGLSLLFALLITGIGAMIVLYTGGYLHGHPQQHRFVLFTLMFMSSMLGVVLADNLLLLFIFWELTSFTSYLMIGFNHREEASRRAALQALLVTGAGGLFLLAGLILAGKAAGTMTLSGLAANREAVLADPMLPVIVGLILVGAFTKSAQVPFHFWLPNAMQAPTPASAYLHSSTMVKAGVYLLARLHPVFGDAPGWSTALTLAGAATLLTGAVMAAGQVYLKRLLAYTTVAALGAMVMTLGAGTETAITAAVVFLLAHAGYKAALFLVAGIIDHATGEKNTDRLGGLRTALPRTAIAAAVAAASMAGLPLAYGFIAKELSYAAWAGQPWLTAILIAGGACFVLVAWRTGIRPFIGTLRPTPHAPHEAPWSMLLGPVLLGAASLAFGCFPFLADRIVASAASAIHGAPVTVHLHLWHGLNRELLLSGLTLALGAALIAVAGRLPGLAARFAPLAARGPDRGYDAMLRGLLATAGWQTRMLQNGSLRRYLLVTVIFLCTLVVVGFARAELALSLRPFSPVSLPVALIAAVIMAAAVAATRSSSRLGAVAAMGVVGFGVALVFIFFGAPDLAMTQLVVETLSVVLLVSAFYYLPPFTPRSGWRSRTRDLVVSSFAGLVMTLLTLVAAGVQLRAPISSYFEETSVPLGHGRNIVNVILVDYRGLDTLGEITVLAVAGLGALALLRLRHSPGGKP